jgi:hypothetical protein
MGSIFLSYSRDTAAVVDTLAADIKELGHSVWLDRELSGGQTWWNQILEGVRASDVFVFALTQQSLNSVACMREYGYASALGKPILPVLLSDGVAVNLLPPALAQIQVVDYRGLDRGAALRLARAFQVLPPPRPLPNPLPPLPDVPLSYLGGVAEQLATGAALSFEEQRSLLFEIRRGLREAGTQADARTLLEQLRARRDVYAAIAEEIDGEPVSPRDRGARRDHVFGPRIRTTSLERVIVAIIGGGAWFAAGASSSGLTLGAFFGVPMALLGALTGTRHLFFFGGLIGAAAGWTSAMMLADSTERYIVGAAFGVPLGLILGGVAGIYFKDRSRRRSPGRQ